MASQQTTWPEAISWGEGVARAVRAKSQSKILALGCVVVSLSFLLMTKRFLGLLFVSDRLAGLGGGGSTLQTPASCMA